ncbi:MAG: response regulator [Gemmobacter sp.]
MTAGTPPPSPATATPAAAPADAGEDAALALLGHDIRAALSDVIGGLRLIDPEPMDPAVRVQIERVRAAGELLARLLEEGLAAMLGETEPAQAGNVQLARLLRDVQMRWSGRARAKGLEFAISGEGDLPRVITTDRIGLERILSNVLSNAIKYTDSGRVQLAVFRDTGGELVFEVRDNGPGFSGAALAQLFQFAGRPVGTLKPGSGLGLHIAKELALRAGGDLLVRNLSDGGAAVRLILPADSFPGRAAETGGETGPETGEDAEPATLPDLTDARVLLAEDSRTNQTLIAALLERLGAEVEIAEDGVEAVNALERATFDLALIDIEMPRLSGIEVIRALRSQSGPQAATPVLAVTAYVLRANREAIYAAGADGILAKPFGGIGAFGAAITRVLNRSAPPETAVVPSGPGPEAPVLLPGHLERLVEVTGPEGSRELFARLQQDLRHVERQVVMALAEPDWAELRAQTHVLIALAGAVGAQRLQYHAETLNTAAHRRDPSGLPELSGPLLVLLDDLIHYLATNAPGGAA